MNSFGYEIEKLKKIPSLSYFKILSKTSAVYQESKSCNVVFVGLPNFQETNRIEGKAIEEVDLEFHRDFTFCNDNQYLLWPIGPNSLVYYTPGTETVETIEKFYWDKDSSHTIPVSNAGLKDCSRFFGLSCNTLRYMLAVYNREIDESNYYLIKDIIPESKYTAIRGLLLSTNLK